MSTGKKTTEENIILFKSMQRFRQDFVLHLLIFKNVE